MKIGILTDSTCDLPQNLAKKHNIAVLPLYINVGANSYLDGVDLSRAEFYEGLTTWDDHPTTAMPGAAMFNKAYQRLADEGATEIISIHISHSLSGVINVANVASQTAPVPVTVFDGGTLSLGTGFLALRAAEAAAAGESLTGIMALLADQRRRTHVFAALETLEYLRRGGRINGVVAALGSRLQLKPILTMNDGEAKAKRVRTSKTADKRIIDMLADKGALEQVALVHTHSPNRADRLRKQATHLLPAGDILSVDITPVFGVHLGPGAGGFVCVQKS